MHKSLNLILAINVLIIIIYTVVAYDPYDEYYIFLIAFCIVIHSSINFIVAIILAIIKKKESAKTYLLVAVIVLVIGFPSCFLVGVLGH